MELLKNYMTTIHHRKIKRFQVDVQFLDDSDITNIASIAARFAPVGSTVSMQADTHGAGNVYVGLIMTFEDKSIPINMISGDIGCGLSIVPFVSKDGKHIKECDLPISPERFYSYTVGIIRRTLKRGRAAEEQAGNRAGGVRAEFDHRSRDAWQQVAAARQSDFASSWFL